MLNRHRKTLSTIIMLTSSYIWLRSISEYCLDKMAIAIISHNCPCAVFPLPCSISAPAGALNLALSSLDDFLTAGTKELEARRSAICQYSKRKHSSSQVQGHNGEFWSVWWEGINESCDDEILHPTLREEGDLKSQDLFAELETVDGIRKSVIHFFRAFVQEKHKKVTSHIAYLCATFYVAFLLARIPSSESSENLPAGSKTTVSTFQPSDSSLDEIDALLILNDSPQ